MKSLIIIFAILTSPHYAASQVDDLSLRDKDKAKEQIFEVFFKELPDSIMNLPYDSLYHHIDRFTFLIPNDIRDKWMNPKKQDYARVGYAPYSSIIPDRISRVTFEGDAYSAGITKNTCIEKINSRIPSSEEEWDLIVDADSGKTLTLTIRDEQNDSTYERALVKNYIEEEEFLVHKLGKTAIIRFEAFLNNIHLKFRRASMKLVPESVDTLILDLRDNPGGYVDAFNDIVSEFLPKKTPLNKFAYRNSTDTSYSFSDNYGLWTHLKKIYVIVNRKSASASEMLAGVLSKLPKTEVIGSKSYGKGRQQVAIPISTKSTLHVTNAEFFPGLDVKVDGIGIIPKRPLKRLEEGKMLNVNDIINLRQEYTIPSVEAMNDPRIKNREYLADYVWDRRGELFLILYKQLYKE